MELPKYSKVFTLGEEPIKEILEGKIIVEEKTDGSLFRIYIDNNQMFFGSKSVDFIEIPPDKMFLMIVDKSKENLKSIDFKNHVVTIFGEYIMKPRHNTLCYEKTPKNNLVVFDINLDGNWLDYENKKNYAELLGFDVAPLLFRGEGKKLTKEKIEELLKIQSFLGKTTIEGIVIKNYERPYNLIKYPYLNGKFMVGKYVNEEFKELNKENWKQIKKGVVETLIESLRNENRWKKSLQHLKEQGKLENSPRDIADIIREVIKDVEEEEGENIKNLLFEHYWREIKTGMVKGLPEWYKKQLAFGDS